MANKGIAPYDPTTPVGQFRVGFGDTHWVELNPPEPGFGDYDSFSDAEIEAFISLAGGSVPRAIALAYTQMAAAWNKEGVSIRTDDLAYDSSKSVGSWLSLADYWNNIADNEANDYFKIIPDGCDFIPEGTPAEWGRRYSIDSGWC